MADEGCLRDPLGVHESEYIGGELRLGDAEVGLRPTGRGVRKIGRARAPLIKRINVQSWIEIRESVHRPRPLDRTRRIGMQQDQRLARARSELEVAHVYTGRKPHQTALPEEIVATRVRIGPPRKRREYAGSERRHL